MADQQQSQDERVAAENIASIMRHYETKLYGEDDTSQPNSRPAPVIPLDLARKKKKRKRLLDAQCNDLPIRSIGRPKAKSSYFWAWLQGSFRGVGNQEVFLTVQIGGMA